MSWDTLQPLTKNITRTQVSVRVFRDRHGRVSYGFSVPKVVWLQHFPADPKTCDVLIGTGEHRGLIAIQPGASTNVAHLAFVRSVRVMAPADVFAGERQEYVAWRTEGDRGQTTQLVMALPTWAMPGYVPAPGEYQLPPSKLDLNEQQEAFYEMLQTNGKVATASALPLWDNDRAAMLRDLAALGDMLCLAGQELMVKNSVYTLGQAVNVNGAVA
jgi:hypothetical protein